MQTLLAAVLSLASGASDPAGLVARHFELINNGEYRAAVAQLDPRLGAPERHRQAYQRLFADGGFVQELEAARWVASDEDFIFVRATLMNRPRGRAAFQSLAYYILRRDGDQLFLVTSAAVHTGRKES